ncbi:FUSC family protein [Leifsonia sp. ZF2019]|uniref:FUSC family protein n=1 Tax=Leifsonia sp. ZF2019 TaxID=2781978 RepID=UPI001CBCD8F6|nr:FUSC family protein [Leifsonia sp. ZF2019]UAJ78679.1 FUSC family protein [Leifsonia sp. ZF2019]
MKASGLASTSIEVGFRAATAVAVPLLVLWAVGRLDLAAYATFGAFTALYGRNEQYRLRLRSVSAAGVVLVASIALGVLIAVLGEPLPLLAAALVLVVGGGTLFVTALQLLPSQPLFFVFALLVCANIPTTAADAWPRIGLAVIVAVFSWLLTMSGWLVRRLAGGRRWTLLKELNRHPRADATVLRDPRVWLTVAQNVVGVLIAGGIALAFGLGHAYWAVVSLVAVIPPARAAHSISRSLHRIVGTVAGVVVAAALLFWSPPALVVILAIVVCQFFAEILVGRHYGSALVFITPMALAVSHLASPAPLAALVGDRVLETVLGAGIGIVLVLLARGVERARGLAA